MFERYREDARRAIFFARWEAQQSGSARIETEHVLLGLVHDADSQVNRLFGLSAHVENFRSQLGVQAQAAPAPDSKDLPLSNPSKRVLAYAAEEAEHLRSQRIGTEHLLLGLLREQKSDVPEVLARIGIEPRSARSRIKGDEGVPVLGREPVETKGLKPLRALVLLVVVIAMIYVIFKLSLGK